MKVGVGKTSLVTMAKTGLNPGRYVAPMGVEVRPISFHGHTLNVWDCAGQKKLTGLKTGYYIEAQGAIVVATQNTLDTIEEKVADVLDVVPNAEILLCLVGDTELGSSNYEIVNVDLSSLSSCKNVFLRMLNML